MTTRADGAQADAVEDSRRSGVVFVVVALTLALAMVGPNLPTPLYPIYQHDFGLTPLMITAVYAVYAGSLIPSLLLFGPMSDAIGRRPVMYAALSLGAAGSVVLACAPGGWALAVGRMLQGLSVGAISGAATAALREVEPTDNRGRAAATAAAAMVGGSAIGPVAAGVMVQYLPAPKVSSFVIHVILLIVIAAALLGYRDAGRRGGWKPQRPHIPAQMRGLFIGSGAAAFLVWSVTALFLALIPSLMTSSLGITNAAVTGLVVTLMLGSSAVVQLTGNRLSPEPIQVVGLLAVIAGLGLLNWASAAESLVLLIVSALVAGTGQGLAFLGSMKRVNLAAPPDELGNVISSFYVVVYTGVGVPVIGVGLLATRISLISAVQIFSAVVAALAVLTVFMLVMSGNRRSSEPD